MCVYLTLLVILLIGFICPVHTPDGAPCGLLNHLSALCKVGVVKLLMGVALYMCVIGCYR